MLQETNPDLYSPQFTLDGENALHIAAAQGFTDLAKQILVRGYTNLLWAENKNHMYPIQMAVETEHFRTAEVLLRSTKDRLNNCLFVSFLSDAHSIICEPWLNMISQLFVLFLYEPTLKAGIPACLCISVHVTRAPVSSVYYVLQCMTKPIVVAFR